MGYNLIFKPIISISLVFLVYSFLKSQKKAK